MGRRLGDAVEVKGTDARGHERLVGVAHGGVGQQQTLLLEGPLRKPLGPLLLENVFGAARMRLPVGDVRHLRLTQIAELQRFLLGDAGIAVNHRVPDELKDLVGPVALLGKFKQLWVVVDIGGVALAGEERRVIDDVFEKADIGLHPADAELLQRPVHGAGGIGKGQAVRGDLHQQRIVKGGDLRSGIAGGGIEAHAETGSRPVCLDRAVVGRELVLGVLGRHAALDGKAVEPDVLLALDADFGVGELVPLGHPDLRLHQVASGDHLGNRVLDLDARIGLDEVEVLVLVHQEFDGAGIDVVDRLGDLQRVVADLLAFLLGQIQRRSDFDHLLVTALNGTVALEEMDDVAMLVAEDLHLDVLGILDIFFEKNGCVAERRLRLGCGALEPLEELLLIAGHAHAAAAAAGGGLDDDWIAGLLGEYQRLFLGVYRLLRAGNHRNAGLFGDFATRDLVAETTLDLRGRTDEGDARALAGLGKLGILGEESVTGMDSVDVVTTGDIDDFVDAEVGVDRSLALADQIGLVGLVAVQRQLVLLGIDRHRADAELRAGPEDADGDLAAVGCHDLLEFFYCHEKSSSNSLRTQIRWR